MYRLLAIAIVVAFPLGAAAQQPEQPAVAEPVDEGQTASQSEDDDATASDADTGPAGGVEAPDAARPHEGDDEPDAGAVPLPPESSVSEAPAQDPGADADVASSSGESRGESGFMDVRLNITLTNENVFAAPGETIPSVPGWRFGRPNSLGTLFFDNYDTRFSGYETLSHLVLYRQHNVESWEAEGALVLRINDLAEDRIDLSDAGSYLRVAYWFDEDRVDQRRVSFTAFPTSSDRMRLGYSYRLSWGGSPTYQRSRSSVPGVKLQYDDGRFYSFVGAKSAIVLDRQTSEERAVLGGLAGVGYDITDMFRVELNGGFFDRGGNELQDVIDQDVQLFGASAQFALHQGYPIGTSVDYMLYRNDPERIGRLFMPESYPGGLSWLVKGEFSVLGQTLKDPATTGGTTIQPASAGDVNVRIKHNRTRYRFDAQYRDLAFILHPTPSLPTYSAFPDAYERTPNYFVAGGADHNIEGTGVTLGVILGIDMPATLTTPTGALPGDTVEGGGSSTAVVRNPNSITILPEGESVLPQLASKLTGRIDFNEYFAGLIDIYYSYDPNQTRLLRDGPNQPFERQFGELNQLGFNLTMQSRF